MLNLKSIHMAKILLQSFSTQRSTWSMGICAEVSVFRLAGVRGQKDWTLRWAVDLIIKNSIFDLQVEQSECDVLNELLADILGEEFGPEFKLQRHFLLDFLTQNFFVQLQPRLESITVHVLKSEEPDLAQTDCFHNLKKTTTNKQTWIRDLSNWWNLLAQYLSDSAPAI